MSGDMSTFGNSLIHSDSPGNLSPTQVTSLSNLNNMIKDPSTDQSLLPQLQQQQQSLMANDTGGVLGSLGRMATGSGLNTSENIGGAALKGIMGIIQQESMMNAAKNQQQNMQNAQASQVAAQKQMLTGGGF